MSQSCGSEQDMTDLGYHVSAKIHLAREDLELLFQAHWLHAWVVILATRFVSACQMSPRPVYLREMRFEFVIVMETASSLSTRRLLLPIASLNVPLSHLSTDEAFFVLVPHVAEKLIRAEKSFMTELFRQSAPARISSSR